MPPSQLLFAIRQFVIGPRNRIDLQLPPRQLTNCRPSAFFSVLKSMRDAEKLSFGHRPLLFLLFFLPLLLFLTLSLSPSLSLSQSSSSFFASGNTWSCVLQSMYKLDLIFFLSLSICLYVCVDVLSLCMSENLRSCIPPYLFPFPFFLFGCAIGMDLGQNKENEGSIQGMYCVYNTRRCTPTRCDTMDKEESKKNHTHTYSVLERT